MSLEALTKAKLLDLAAANDVDVSGAGTKAEIADILAEAGIEADPTPSPAAKRAKESKTLHVNPQTKGKIVECSVSSEKSE